MYKDEYAIHCIFSNTYTFYLVPANTHGCANVNAFKYVIFFTLSPNIFVRNIDNSSGGFS